MCVINSTDAYVLRALKAGATGYLLKNMLRKELLDTIRIVHAEEGRRSPLLALNPTFEFRQRNASRSADEEEIGIRKANEARAHQSVLQTKCASGFGFEFTIRRLRERAKRCDDREVAICVRAPRSFGIVGLFS